MSLELICIHEKGKQDSEYVELKATDACNLKYYIVSDTTYASDTAISNKLRHVYWFAPKDVKKAITCSSGRARVLIRAMRTRQVALRMFSTGG